MLKRQDVPAAERRRLAQGGRTLVARNACFNVVDGLVAQSW
jgi:hypothetical protein